MTNSSFRELIRNYGFQAFLWTQFLGAFNDNLYKIIVSLRAVHVAAHTGSGSEYLALAGAVFVIPFLLFSGYSGHLADAVSKHKVLVAVKVFEIGVMCFGLAVFFSSRIELMLIVLFLMALHSTIFSPAKYGIVPEMLPDKDLSRANGLLEMSTFVAIVLGTSIGTFLFTAWKDEPWKMGVVTLVVAIVGFFVSLRIPHVKPAGATEKFRFNPFAEVIIGTKHLIHDRPLWLTVIAISYFWFLGALFQLDLLLYGSEVLKADDLHVGLMVTCLAVGIGAGSMLSGRLSGDKVELGLVPLGSLLMALFCIVLWASQWSYIASVISLSLLGLASGLFIVPLNAYLQQRSEDKEKGRAIATNNFYNTVGLLIASGVLYVFHDRLHVTPDKLILAFGFVTLLATFYIVKVVPEFLIRFVLWMATHTVYKIRIVGHENVPFRGPALLVANHTSHIDGFLIGACIQRFIRFMIWKPYYELKALNWFFRLTNAIPVGSSPRDIVESIQQARKQLAAGHVVCIFAEGAISRTGNMLPFKRGLEKIVKDLDIPVIPVHLDRLWGSIFSFKGGKFFWKWPRRIPYPVTVSFGQPMPAYSATAHQVRQAIEELGSDAAAHRKSSADTLSRRFIKNARKSWSGFAMADSTGRELTYGKALAGGLIVADWMRKERGPEEMIGVLLPPSVGGALVNIGITLAGKVPVNLNFTAGPEAMASASEQCGIKTTITSKVFLAKANVQTPDGAVFVEDLLKSAGSFARLMAYVRARWMPAGILAPKQTPDSMATVIFSSGSTGTPKGVMLSQYNIISNIEAIAQVFWIAESDRIVGVLPFFHSFGFTVTIWFPLIACCGVVYHPNPTDAKAIGALVLKHHATLLLSTPTFCSTYIRKCSKEEFASLRWVLVGAEKLRDQIAAGFREKFGLDLLEGYGCTEMAPVVAVNGPNYEAGRDSQIGAKAGTVGHPLPGVAVRIVDPNTMEPVEAGEEGLMLVKGANRMTGYLNQPARTAEVVQDGWYVTGDIATVDDEGFIRITDRLSRFSKIGGEMVPHLKVEEAIYAIIGEHGCAVTGIPDEQRGERLVAFYTAVDITPAALWQQLSDTSLPRLWLPKRENFYQIDTLPTLGTGKLDLRAVKNLALTKANGARVAAGETL